MSYTTSELVRKFTSTEPRFESPGDDPRLFKGTAEALKELAAGSSPEFPTAEWSQEQVKEWFRQTGPAFAAVIGAWAGEVPESIASAVEKTDLEHEGIPVRVFTKKDAPADLPVVVYLHGGGFAIWSMKDPAYDAYLTRLAASGECVIVAVDYRLTPDAPFPACLDDSYAVVKWVSEGGALVSGVSKGKVVIAGDSAGGSLAFGTAIKAKKADEDFIAGLYLLCPYTALVLRETSAEQYPSLAEFGDGYFLGEGILLAVNKAVCDESEKEKWSKSPLLAALCATKEEMTGLPPTSVVVGELDMIRDIGIELHHRLKDAGVDSILTMICSSIHDQQLFTKHSPQVTNQSIRDLTGFAKFVAGGDRK